MTRSTARAKPALGALPPPLVVGAGQLGAVRDAVEGQLGREIEAERGLPVAPHDLLTVGADHHRDRPAGGIAAPAVPELDARGLVGRAEHRQEVVGIAPLGVEPPQQVGAVDEHEQLAAIAVVDAAQPEFVHAPTLLVATHPDAVLFGSGRSAGGAPHHRRPGPEAVCYTTHAATTASDRRRGTPVPSPVDLVQVTKGPSWTHSRS